jgi:hypothetical protein
MAHYLKNLEEYLWDRIEGTEEIYRKLRISNIWAGIRNMFVLSMNHEWHPFNAKFDFTAFCDENRDLIYVYHLYELRNSDEFKG